MIRQIIAEFRKLFTVRATYAFLAFGLAILIFFAFYVDGYHTPKTVGSITDPGHAYSEIINALTFLSTLFAFVGVLLVTNEYRYNTIMYTLTSSNNRFKVFLSKFIVVSCFAIVFSLLFGALSPLLSAAGLHLKGISMVHQVIPVWDTVWRAAFYGWGYSMLALLIAFLIRNQVGAIIVLLLVPGMVETLLGLLLKSNTKYLPFTALGGVLKSNAEMPGQTLLSHGQSAVVVLIYIAVVGIIAAVLFQRRDAN